jgi:hypothetical protein
MQLTEGHPSTSSSWDPMHVSSIISRMISPTYITNLHFNRKTPHPYQSQIIECSSCDPSLLPGQFPGLRVRRSTKLTLFLSRQPISLALRPSRTLATMVKPAGLMSNRYKTEDMPDLSGKVAIVTGGSRGIGEAAVTALVQKGCEGEFSHFSTSLKSLDRISLNCL